MQRSACRRARSGWWSTAATASFSTCARCVQEGHDLLRGMRIQGGDGFVGEYDVRPLAECPGYGDPLLLSAGQPADPVEGPVRQAHTVQAVEGLLLHERGKNSGERERPVGIRAKAPAQTLSKAVRRGHQDGSSGKSWPSVAGPPATGATASFQCRRHRLLMTPGVRRAIPMTQRRVVDLPEPLAPRNARSSPARTSKSTPLRTGRSSERLPEAPYGEQRGVHYRFFSVRFMVLASSKSGW